MTRKAQNSPIQPLYPETVGKAYRYYLKGLNCTEIAKLLDLSPRTIQRYVTGYRFKERASPDTLEQRADGLRKRGHTYKEIAHALGIGKTSVYYLLRRARERNA